MSISQKGLSLMSSELRRINSSLEDLKKKLEDALNLDPNLYDDVIKVQINASLVIAKANELFRMAVALKGNGEY